MLYDPEIMRHVAAQQREDRLKEVEQARLLKEVKRDRLPVINWLNAIKAVFPKPSANKAIICTEAQIALSKAKC